MQRLAEESVAVLRGSELVDLCDAAQNPAFLAAKAVVERERRRLGVFDEPPLGPFFVFKEGFSGHTGLCCQDARSVGVVAGIAGDFVTEKTTLAHEIAHALAKRSYGRSDRARLGNSVTGDMLTRTGWTIHRKRKDGTHTTLFSALEETAALLFEQVTYAPPTSFSVNMFVNVRSNCRLSACIYSNALRLFYPDRYAKLRTQAYLRGWNSLAKREGLLAIPVSATGMKIGGDLAMAGETPLFLTALDMLSREVYPKDSPLRAREKLRENVMRVQMYMPHHEVMREFRRAFGGQAVRFLARLKVLSIPPEGGKNFLSSHAALLTLFAHAGRLPERERIKLRREICDAVLEPERSGWFEKAIGCGRRLVDSFMGLFRRR